MLISHANSPLNSNPPAPSANVLPQSQADVNQANQTANNVANIKGHQHQDTVTLSATALSLSAKNTSAADISSTENKNTAMKGTEKEPTPKPELPNDGDKASAYIEYRKAKVQYQIYADMANIATGNNNHMSPATAHYLSHNDQARAATVDIKAQQQQVASMQTYAATTSTINDKGSL